MKEPLQSLEAVPLALFYMPLSFASPRVKENLGLISLPSGPFIGPVIVPVNLAMMQVRLPRTTRRTPNDRRFTAACAGWA